MMRKTWIVLAVGTALIIGGLATVSAVGVMNGDCDQTQDRDQLKDGSCDQCPCDETLTSDSSSDGMNGDCLQNQTRDQLKDGSCQDCPCATETLVVDATAGTMAGDCLQNQTRDQLKDGSCDQCPCDVELVDENSTVGFLHMHMWAFFYAELQDASPYAWASACQCGVETVTLL